MATLHKSPHPARSQADAKFVVLDLFGHADDHGLLSGAPEPPAPSDPAGLQPDTRLPSMAPTAPAEVRNVPSRRRLSVKSMLSSWYPPGKSHRKYTALPEVRVWLGAGPWTPAASDDGKTLCDLASR